MYDEKIFMSIVDANKYLGLGITYLQHGCKNGTIPHIKLKQKYLINVPLFLEKLNKESEDNIVE